MATTKATPATVTFEFDRQRTVGGAARITEIPLPTGGKAIGIEVAGELGLSRVQVSWDEWVRGLGFLVAVGTIPVGEVTLLESVRMTDPGRMAADFAGGAVELARAEGRRDPMVLEVIEHFAAQGYYVGFHAGRGRR